MREVAPSGAVCIGADERSGEFPSALFLLLVTSAPHAIELFTA